MLGINYQNTPLHIAVYHGKIEAAAFLIQKGADVNAYNRTMRPHCFMQLPREKRQRRSYCSKMGLLSMREIVQKIRHCFLQSSEGKTK